MNLTYLKQTMLYPNQLDLFKTDRGNTMIYIVLQVVQDSVNSSWYICVIIHF